MNSFKKVNFFILFQNFRAKKLEFNRINLGILCQETVEKLRLKNYNWKLIFF